MSKQADVIMLFHLFRPEELQALFERLGYAFDEALMRRCIDYYQARTSHGSTLSKVVFTSVVHREDCAEGCRLFLSVLRSDLFDVQGGTTPEGVHLGAMAGTVDIVLRHYAGVELTEEGVTLSPDMPERLRRLSFRVQYRGRWLEVTLTRRQLRVAVDRAELSDVPVRVEDHWHLLAPGGVLELPVTPAADTRRRAAGAQRAGPLIHVDEARLGGGQPGAHSS